MLLGETSKRRSTIIHVSVRMPTHIVGLKLHRIAPGLGIVVFFEKRDTLGGRFWFFFFLVFAHALPLWAAPGRSVSDASVCVCVWICVCVRVCVWIYVCVRPSLQSMEMISKTY